MGEGFGFQKARGAEMTYQIPKQLTRYANKFVVGTMKQDLLGLATAFLAIMVFKLAPFSLKINAAAATVVVVAGSIFLMGKLDERISNRISFSRRLSNASYYDHKTGSIVDIARISDNAVFLKNGTLLAVLKINPIDFSILSEDEQEAVIGKYRTFLNSLSSPVQIASRSVGINLDTWLHNSETKIRDNLELNGQARLKQFQTFKGWISEVVEQSTIRNRVFYMAVPYYPETFQGLSFFQSVKQFICAFIGKPAVIAAGAGKGAKAALRELSDVAEDCMEKLEETGVEVSRLGDDELVSLYSSYFNDAPDVDTSFITPVMWRTD